MTRMVPGRVFSWSSGLVPRPVLRPSGEQIERVGQQWQNGRQRGLRARRIARQVDNERRAKRPADRPAERRERRVQQAVGAHPLSQPLDQPLADQPRRLRRNIARSQPRASRRNHQTAAGGMAAQRIGDKIKLVGQGLRDHHGSPRLSQRLRHRGTGEVRLLAAKAAVADGQDSGAGVGVEQRRHRA